MKVITTTTTKQVHIELSGEELKQVLVAAKIVPEDAYLTVYVRVPGGGDWSNTDLDVDKSSPLTIRYETRASYEVEE